MYDNVALVMGGWGRDGGGSAGTRCCMYAWDKQGVGPMGGGVGGRTL